VVLRERDYGMLFAERGIGKTWWSLACALALAGGGRAAFLKAARPRRVVYVDGEMPLEDMRDRINALLRGMSDQEIVQASMNFTLVNRDLHEELFLPSLTSDVGRDDWAAWLESKAPDLVVLDNISSLTSGSIENNEEDWAPIGKWAVHQRRQRAVAWVHHASRGGTARGTSKREDPMDFVWKLRGVESQETGALVTLHWDKGRNVVDDVLEDRMLQLSTDGSKEAPISVWNEVPKADGIVREMDQRERNMIPIAEAIFRRNPTIGQKEFRAQCREIYKDKYGRGIENTVIDRLYGGRDQWETA
jgi:putative DNA primase/helicase